MNDTNIDTPAEPKSDKPPVDPGPPGNPYDVVFILFLFPLILVFALKVVWILLF